MKISVTFLCSLLLLVAPILTEGQNAIPADSILKPTQPTKVDSILQKVQNPKIGLVLSGGGAKGLAHIGTLKVIDSLGIKIDYIAGTSMGAIIGSLYASGYSGKQLDSIFYATDFDKIISDDIPRRAETFYERKDRERYAVTLPFKDFQVSLPSSLSKGQNIYNFLSKLMGPVNQIDDFSKLPIPFFCIATNVVTGEEVVLDKGSLPKAVNASGALPSLFAPVQIDNMLLIDGGVIDNYPIEKLRKKGMDIIIGVDVQDDKKEEEELQNALDILSQINNFRTISDMEIKRPKTDIYIQPDIEQFTVISFDEGQAIITKGKEASLQKIDDLIKVATGYRRPDLKNIASDSLYLTRIEIKGNKQYSRAFISGRFKLNAPEMIAYDDISNGINNLQATNNFKKINYSLIPELLGYALEIEVVESDVRNYLRLGIHYDELLRSSALINLSRKGVLVSNDVISADVIVGDNIRYNLDYYIDKGRYWSIGVNSNYVQFDQDIQADFVADVDNTNLGVNSIEVKYKDWTNQVFMRSRFNKNLYLTAGLEFKYLDIFTSTISDPNRPNEDLTFDDSLYTSLYGEILVDSMDNMFFPNEGWRINGDFHVYLANSEQEDFSSFSIAQLQVQRAFSFDKLSFIGDAQVGIAIGNPANSSLDFYLGGYGSRPINNFVSFYGYDFVSISGDTMIKFGITADYEIFKKNHINFTANYANVDDELFEQDDWFSQARYTGYAIGYGIETFLGPIEIKYSFSPQLDDDQFFVSLGYRF
ncbi:patatin-like phospholipase family protein [Nonlabens tegetincola]|uniref:patatin-like phospholipase family protein n=1 Tax=Nonlabens tegetincola TaxID=323273 RepID=UPI000CF454EF|nr:patatin-like phospholipase family protein [Nonlabens tegetincola]